jgi:hypothetical protein
MNLIDNNGTVVTDSAFRALFPQVSFPANLSQVDVEPYGYNVVVPSAPIVSPNTFYYVSEGSPGLVNYVWTQTWVLTPVPLASAQAQQIQNLSSACSQSIKSGFTSSALGSTYTYPSGLVDQQNLSTAVSTSMIPGTASTWTTPFWCANSSGTWAWISHTASQIQQVQIDWLAAKSALQSKYASLSAQVLAVQTTVDDVAKIVWTNPTSST